MPRATKAHKARLLNAAYRLLGQRIETAEAARRLADEFALSLRQAYRYLEQATSLRAPVPVVEPTVAVTFKLPVSLVRALRAYAQRQRTHVRADPQPGADRVFRCLASATWLSDQRAAALATFSSTMPSIAYGRISWPTRTRFCCRLEGAHLRPR